MPNTNRTLMSNKKIKYSAYIICIALWVSFVITIFNWENKSVNVSTKMETKVETLTSLRKLNISCKKMESSAVSYYFTHNDVVLDSYNIEKSNINYIFDEINKTIEKDDKITVDEINKLYSEWFSLTEKSIGYIKSQNNNANGLISKDFYERKIKIDKIEQKLLVLITEEDTEYDALSKFNQDLQKVFLSILITTAPIYSIVVYLLLLIISETQIKIRNSP